MGPPWTLTRIVGGAMARELLLFPEKLTGEQALWRTEHLLRRK